MPKRYAVLKNFANFYMLTSFSIRLILYIISFGSMEFSILSLAKIFLLGFVFDLGMVLFFTLLYSLFLVLIPRKLIGSWFDKATTYFILFIILLISIFSFLAEFPFWEEFGVRFNFIAVDYLIYTYEVFENINQSYPIPLLIMGILLMVFGLFYLFYKRKVFQDTFQDKVKFSKRILVFLFTLVFTLFYTFFIKNNFAEWSSNLYENELSKNGAFSFVAAFRSNELDFNTFYPKLEDKIAFDLIKKELHQNNQTQTGKAFWDIKRNSKSDSAEIYPNVILICIESFSADFMQRFGNTQNITPNIDKIAKESIFFTNMYATGTRTVRGMEAITLCVPPTPGNSIVRRPNNDNIFSVADIFRQKQYNSFFIYGGDGYFDNMNTFFGGNGFTIVDRNRGNPLSDNIKSERINIEDNEVKFENAWGIADEDIFNKTIKIADKNFKEKKRFFNFIMTTSNHKPYTFPEKAIDLPQGTREAAVKYTDFAIGKFLHDVQKKPWFANTVFVIVADHCASSAGKWEININKHHIPAMIYNSKHKAVEINKLVSQIDLMPTVFGVLNWNYSTSLYGKDIQLMKPEEERALIGNYRTLGIYKNNIFTEINDRKQVHFYTVNAKNIEMKPVKMKNDSLKNTTISYYQTASYRFKEGKMKN